MISIVRRLILSVIGLLCVSILDATAQSPRMSVEQPVSVPLSNNDVRDFGGVYLGKSSSLVFTVRNSGDADLTGLAVQVDGPNAAEITLAIAPASTIPGPRGSTTFTMQFLPTSPGPKAAALHLVGNNPTTPSFTVLLTGTGIPSETQNTPPTLNLPATGSVVAEATGPDGAVVDFKLTATDLEDGSVPVVTFPASGTVFPIGITPVAVSATDSGGLTTTAMLAVIVQDTTPPVTPVLPDASGQCSVVVTAPTTTDLVAGPITGVTQNPLTYSSQGTYKIQWSFMDKSGNVTLATQTVVVKDTIPPAAPSLPTVNGQGSASVTPPIAMDNCAGAVAGTTQDPLVYNTQGTFTVHWSFNDGNGNTSFANQTVVVKDTIPPTPPVLGQVNGQCSVTVTAPTAVDAVAGVITGTTSDPLVYNTQGTFTVHWSFNDGNGNTSVANQTVVVKDTIPPAVPSLQTVNGQGSASVTPPTAMDNCAGVVTGTTQDPLVYNTQGTFTVHWSFNDGNGNTSVADQTVVVKDTPPPTVPVLATVTGQCSATVPVATTVDARGAPVLGTSDDPLIYTSQGTFTVHWTFTDKNGLQSRANQTVIVRDTEPPLLPTLSSLTLEAPATVPVPLTTDSCTGLLFGATVDPRVYRSPGTYVVHWTFDDLNGNRTTATQTVVVRDTVPPVLSLPTSPLVLEATSAAGAVATFNVSAIDAAAGAVEVTAVPPSGSLFPVGETVVTVSAKDASGNQSQGTFVVRVNRKLAGWVVYGRRPSPADRDGSIWIADLDSGVDRRLTSGRWPAVSGDGTRLLFQRLSEATPARGHVFQRLIRAGTEQLFAFNYSRIHREAFTRDGTQVIVNSPEGAANLYRANAAGALILQPDGTANAPLLLSGREQAGVVFHGASVDPVSGAIALFRSQSLRLDPSHPLHAGGLYIVDADGHNLRHVPNTTASIAEPFTTADSDLNDSDPVWSPDGQWLAFREGTNLFKIRPSGLDRQRLTTARDEVRVFARASMPMAWTPDGQSLVVPVRVNGVDGLYLLSSDGTGALQRLTPGRPKDGSDAPEFVAGVLPPPPLPIQALPVDAATSVSFVPAGPVESWIVPPVTQSGSINRLIPVAAPGTKLLSSPPGQPEVGFLYGPAGWVPDVPLTGPTTAALRLIFPNTNGFALTFVGQPAAITPVALHFGDNLVGNPGSQPAGVSDLVGDLNPGAGLEIRLNPDSTGPDYEFSRVRWVPGVPVFNPGQAALIHVGGPLVIRQPQPLKLSPGAANQLSVEVLAGGKYTYQWFKDGTPIPGATGPILPLDPNSPNSPGNYQVVITANGISTVSDTVRVEFPPLTIVQFTAPDRPIALGGSFSATVQVTGGLPPYQYQWFHYDLPLPGQTQPALAVAGFQLSDAGAYQVDVVDQAGQKVRRQFSISPDITPLPFTDDFQTGIPNGFANRLSANSGFGLGNNIDATLQTPTEPRHGGLNGGASLWLTWQPTASGIAALRTAGSLADTVVAVYRRTNPNIAPSLTNLTLVTANDDDGAGVSGRVPFSAVRFNAVANELYFIAVDGKNAGTNHQAGPGRDLIVFAWDLKPTADIVPEIFTQPKDLTTDTNQPVTLTLDLPPAQKADPGLTIQWYRDDQALPGATGATFSANPGDNPVGLVGRYVAVVRIRNQSGQVEEVSTRVVEVQLHEGSRLNNRFATDDFEKLGAGSGTGPAGGRGLPAGFTLASAERHYFSAVGGSSQPKEPLFGIANGGAGVPVTDSYWYRIDAPGTGVLVVDTAGSQGDTRLDLFDPASDTPDPGNQYPFDGLRELAFNDNATPGVIWSRVAVPCTQGQSFFVRISGVGNNGSLVQVNINFEEPLAAPNLSPKFEGILGHAAVLPATVTTSVPATFQWYLGNQPLPGQTNSLLTLEAVQSSDQAAQFSLKLTSLAGVSTQSATVPLSVLKPFNRIDANTLFFAFDNLPNGTYQVQRSTNLAVWKNILTNTSHLGDVFKLTNSAAPGNPTEFFRVVAP